MKAAVLCHVSWQQEARTVSDQILVENDVSAWAEASALAWCDDIIDCCLLGTQAPPAKCFEVDSVVCNRLYCLW